jgi:zinc transport system substrate-binding protein
MVFKTTKILKTLLLLLYIILTSYTSVIVAEPALTPKLKIVTSIKPFYNLIAAIAEPICELQLLVRGNASPHDYTLKPSDIKMLKAADLIFWGGPSLEPYLVKTLQQHQHKILTIDLANLPNIEKLPIRNSKNWGRHGNHKHPECCGHNFDPHIWLSLRNAKVIVKKAATILTKHDPYNKIIYQKNLKSFLTELTTLDTNIKQKFAAISQQQYLVFHDAYQYFEKHYSLNPLGAITLHPEIPPGIKHVQALKQLMLQEPVQCFFREPQFQPNFLHTLTKATQIKSGILDPIGNDAHLGSQGLFDIITKSCR